MASYPYISGAGSVQTLIQNLRKSLPSKLDSDKIKQYGLASNNESHLINVVSFLGLIDEEGKFTDDAKSVFSTHSDEEFSNNFSKMISNAYSELFELYGPDDTWNKDKDVLINFFRKSDKTSDAIGGRQAKVFEVLAIESGKREAGIYPKPQQANKPNPTKQTKASATGQSKKANPNDATNAHAEKTTPIVGLNVKIEVNLPINASDEAYDSIFRSIRKHLIDG